MLLPGYRLKLYRNFKAIESLDYQTIVRFYETYEEDIRELYFEEQFDCTVAYADALFETGQFCKHLVMADHILETVIMQNIDDWGGEDLYAKTLFRKAASLFNLGQYPQAEHVLRELIKLDPTARLPVRFLKTCLSRQRPAWVARWRRLATGLILLSAATIAGEFLFLKNHFPAGLTWAKMGHWALLASGVLLLAAAELKHGWRCWTAAEAFAEQLRRRKK